MASRAGLGRPGFLDCTSCSHRTMANLERTFIAIKPDGVQRGLVGEIIKRFEQKGFRLVAMKFLRVTQPSPPTPLLLGRGSFALPPLLCPRLFLESESALLAGFAPRRILLTSAPHQAFGGPLASFPGRGGQTPLGRLSFGNVTSAGARAWLPFGFAGWSCSGPVHLANSVFLPGQQEMDRAWNPHCARVGSCNPVVL